MFVSSGYSIFLSPNTSSDIAFNLYDFLTCSDFLMPAYHYLHSDSQSLSRHIEMTASTLVLDVTISSIENNSIVSSFPLPFACSVHG